MGVLHLKCTVGEPFAGLMIVLAKRCYTVPCVVDVYIRGNGMNNVTFEIAGRECRFDVFSWRVFSLSYLVTCVSSVRLLWKPWVCWSNSGTAIES